MISFKSFNTWFWAPAIPLTSCMTNLPSFLLYKMEVLIPIMDAREDKSIKSIW